MWLLSDRAQASVTNRLLGPQALCHGHAPKAGAAEAVRRMRSALRDQLI